MAQAGELETQLKALMLAGLAGDGGAHSAMLKVLASALRRYYGRRLGAGAADLEDLVQETLIAVHSRRATYEPSAPFTAWAYAIARYKLIDFYRRQGRRPTAPLEAADALFAADETDGWSAAQDLNRVLANVDSRTAALIRETRLEGLSMQEAAARAGMSETAAKVGVHRGLKKLMARFAGGDDHVD